MYMGNSRLKDEDIWGGTNFTNEALLLSSNTDLYMPLLFFFKSHSLRVIGRLPPLGNHLLFI